MIIKYLTYIKSILKERFLNQAVLRLNVADQIKYNKLNNSDISESLSQLRLVAAMSIFQNLKQVW